MNISQDFKVSLILLKKRVKVDLLMDALLAVAEVIPFEGNNN